MEYSSASCAKESFEIVRKLKLSSMANFSNFFCPTHVRPEDFRNFDTAVFTLVVLSIATTVLPTASPEPLSV